MEFFIRQGASEPILKMRLIDDTINDKSEFNDLLETATITFEMFDVETKDYEILNSSCDIVSRITKFNNPTLEYYIVHRFTSYQTSNVGRYEGKITIQFNDTNMNPTTKLILPVKEKLYITIF